MVGHKAFAHDDGSGATRKFRIKVDPDMPCTLHRWAVMDKRTFAKVDGPRLSPTRSRGFGKMISAELKQWTEVARRANVDSE